MVTHIYVYLYVESQDEWNGIQQGVALDQDNWSD